MRKPQLLTTPQLPIKLSNVRVQEASTLTLYILILYSLVYLILAQKRWTHVLHLEHSIIGLPANGLRQKQVTRFQDSSSADTVGGESMDIF